MRRAPPPFPPLSAARLRRLGRDIARSRWTGSVAFLAAVYGLAMLLPALLLAC